MIEYPYHAEIEMSRLRLDLRNPRIAGDFGSQKEAFEALAAEQKGKLLALSRHIAEKGLNPAIRFIVIPDDDKESAFIVVDANRRLAALKALEQPELMQAILSEPQMSQLRALASMYNPTVDVPCVVFAKRDDADVWVELLHEGQSDGAGVVEWTAQQKARHRTRGRTQPVNMQVLDFVMREGSPHPLAAERNRKGTFPVSTLERALTSPYVRERLGIEIREGRVETAFSKAEVLKGLTKIVNEIGTGTVKVSHFMTKDDRTSYIDGYKSDELPASNTQGETLTPLAEAPEATQVAAKPKDRRRSGARTKMVRPEFSVDIREARINNIYVELKRKLLIREVPNAVGVLFRTFLELSIDDYIKRNLDSARFGNKTLQHKQEAVMEDLRTKGKLDRKDMAPLRLSASESSGSVFTILNAYVHNPQMTPSDSELTTLWERYEHLIHLLWE